MWISTLIIDLLNCTASLNATDNPDHGGSSVEVEFEQVGNVRVDRYHDASAPCLGDMTGVLVKSIGGGRARFRLDTGDATVEFEAAEHPRVTNHEDSAIDTDRILIHDSTPSPRPPSTQ